MSYKKVNLGLTLAAIVATTIAIFYYHENINLSQKVNENEKRILQADTIKDYLAINAIDSVLFQGKYKEAMRAYQNYQDDSNSPIKKPVNTRIQFVQNILSLQRKLRLKDSSNIEIKDTVITERSASPEEVRAYDSIQFALTKSMLQVENLKKQLKQKQSGEYLIFEVDGGKEVYYVGSVKNKQANGKGIAIFESGSRYEGDWQNNQRHGEGSFYWPDGEYYIGEFKNDKRAGKGTYYWPNGEKFTGEWKNNRRNGRGVFYNKEGEIVAQGIWNEDELVDVQKK